MTTQLLQQLKIRLKQVFPNAVLNEGRTHYFDGKAYETGRLNFDFGVSSSVLFIPQETAMERPFRSIECLHASKLAGELSDKVYTVVHYHVDLVGNVVQVRCKDEICG
jgi:hypothetical protein